MKRQALVIGLGQFGMSVASALTDRNVEVMAVDVSETRVRAASALVTETACFDATDEMALARVSPQRRDVCVCAIGDDAKEASIICTALLKQMGARRVISRYNDDLHARILKLVGANQVVNPEREFGERFANRIVHEQIRSEMPLGDGVLISEVAIPESFLGRNLEDLALPKRFGITVIAIRKGSTGQIEMPAAGTILESEDLIVVVAEKTAVAKMMESNPE